MITFDYYDYIVVGGGTAGAIVAARLAEQGDLRVALLEAGPSDENNQQILHLARWEELLGGELDFNYAIEAQTRGNSLIRHARGKMLGGSSSHNTCIAFVPPERDFQSWVNMGAIGWHAQDVQPFFDRLLSKVALERASETNPCAAAFVEAAQQAGFPPRFSHKKS